MAIVKQKNPKTGITYVYESHSYRDKETKQPRAKRKLIGRLDNETGEVIPTRSRKNMTTKEFSSVGTPPKEPSVSYSSLLESVKEKDEIIKSLRSELSALKRERQKLSEQLLAIGQNLKQ